MIQRSSVRQSEDPMAVPQIVPEVLRSSGQPLNAATRAFMESHFAQDFSHVRVHTDARAAESALAVDAMAYTVGRNVVFGDGQYAPETSAGRRVLAHELAHVVQQSGDSGGSNNLALGASDSAHEHEADAISARVGDSVAKDSAAVKADGLSNISSGVVQRVHPAVAIGGAVAAGAAAGAMTFAAALAHARSLATTFPGWLSVLPNCPCTRAGALANPALWGPDANPILSWFHPGAASSFRSNSTFATIPGSAHGQQCTYDSNGNLLTEGPGAGTPDSWSPVTNGASHFTSDVLPWQVLGWRIYSRYWQPNNGNGCAANRGDNTFGRRASEFLP